MHDPPSKFWGCRPLGSENSIHKQTCMLFGDHLNCISMERFEFFNNGGGQGQGVWKLEKFVIANTYVFVDKSAIQYGMGIFLGGSLCDVVFHENTSSN